MTSQPAPAELSIYSVGVKNRREKKALPERISKNALAGFQLGHRRLFLATSFEIRATCLFWSKCRFKLLGGCTLWTWKWQGLWMFQYNYANWDGDILEPICSSSCTSKQFQHTANVAASQGEQYRLDSAALSGPAFVPREGAQAHIPSQRLEDETKRNGKLYLQTLTWISFELESLWLNRPPREWTVSARGVGVVRLGVIDHSWEWSISNFPCSLTRNIISHSMENLAFRSLLRWKMIILPILTP